MLFCFSISFCVPLHTHYGHTFGNGYVCMCFRPPWVPKRVLPLLFDPFPDFGSALGFKLSICNRFHAHPASKLTATSGANVNPSILESTITTLDD